MPEAKVNEDRYHYDKSPDSCPCCHHGIKAINIASRLISRRGVAGDNLLQVVYQCPRDKCQLVFIATYRQESHYRTRSRMDHYVLRDTAPFFPSEPNTPEEIREISPDYHLIYGQSIAAEEFRLVQIAGCGYRKSLEFLIKDYVIHKYPDETDAIKKKQLSTCINEYVRDANVKACASRAAWLGNDETHYVRKWEDKDITDLKTLIRLSASWILNELLTEKYLHEMPS